MANKTITINMPDEEIEKLEYLVDFFQRKSIATVTRSDVIKFLINKVYEVTASDSDIDTVKEFFKVIGVDYDFEVIDFSRIGKEN